MTPANAASALNPVHAQWRRLTDALSPSPAAQPARTALSRLAWGTAAIHACAATGALAIAAALATAMEGAALGSVFAVAVLLLASAGEAFALRSRSIALTEAGGVWADVRIVAAFQRALARPLSGKTGRGLVSVLRRLRRRGDAASGPGSQATLDAPFALLYVAVLATVDWRFALVAAGAVGVAAGGALLAQRGLRAAADGWTTAQERLAVAKREATTRAAALADLGFESQWRERIAELETQAQAAADALQSVNFGARAAAWGFFGAVMCILLAIGAASSADVAALTAAAVLTMRALAPFADLAGAGPLQLSAADLIAIPAPAAAPSEGGVLPKRQGDLRVRGLTVREGDKLLLRNVSFDARPGELIAICGSASAGKSALLEAILGLRPLQAGVVMHDGVDLSALDLDALRLSVGYLPLRAQPFQGPVRETFRLVAPFASEDAQLRALEAAGLAPGGPHLPDGLETRVTAEGGPADEPFGVKVLLAALYAKSPSLLLLDEPGARLDRDGDQIFLRRLAALRGRATVLLVTNRPSHMRMCDRIIRLEHGMVVTDGPVGHVLAS